MTTQQLSAHYRACMEKEVAEICKKRLGALPKNASEEKVGLFARKRVADERIALCRELRGCFDVSLNGGESLGYDELCTAIWGEIEERVPYWQWIVRFCKDRGLSDGDETQVMPWDRFLDPLDVMEFASELEEEYYTDLSDRIADDIPPDAPSARELLGMFAPILDELRVIKA